MFPMPAIAGAEMSRIAIPPVSFIGEFIFSLFEVRHPLLTIVNWYVAETATLISWKNRDIAFSGNISFPNVGNNEAACYGNS